MGSSGLGIHYSSRKGNTWGQSLSSSSPCGKREGYWSLLP